MSGKLKRLHNWLVVQKAEALTFAAYTEGMEAAGRYQAMADAFDMVLVQLTVDVEAERLRDTVLLRMAGCRCARPLLGYVPGVGPRCRLCNCEVGGDMQKTINGIYILVNALGQPYAAIVGDTPALCIERAEFVLDGTWKELYAEGYRVAIASLTIQRVLTDDEVIS